MKASWLGGGLNLDLPNPIPKPQHRPASQFWIDIILGVNSHNSGCEQDTPPPTI